MTKVNVLEKVVAVNNGKEMKFNEGGQIRKFKSWYNPFQLDHGRSRYTLKEIIFYNEDGVKFTNNSGWFGSNNEFNDMKFSSDGKEVEIKKKKEPKFDGTVFFVSEGKDWSNENRASLYIPIAYLDSLGWEVKEVIHEKGTHTRTEVNMVCPKFSIYVSSNLEKHFDKTKELLIAELTKATTPKEVEKIMDDYEHKF